MADESETNPKTRQKKIRDAARRALDEAEARRTADDADADGSKPAPKELNGRDGPDPVRYGDWENKGILSDF